MYFHLLDKMVEVFLGEVRLTIFGFLGGPKELLSVYFSDIIFYLFAQRP